MPWKRIARDVGMLLVLAGLFYVGSLLAGSMDGDIKEPEPTSFSPARTNADRLVQANNWETASRAFRLMTERDPYDGYAWYRLGVCYRVLWYRKVTANEDVRIDSAAKVSVSEQRLLAIETLKKSLQFLRYRGDSMLQLAIIHVQSKEFDTAMDYLDTLVNEKNWRNRNLADIRSLGSGGAAMALPGAPITEETGLHQFRRFWRLVAYEHKSEAKRS